MREPRAGLERARRLADRAIGHAEENEVGLGLGRREPALGQPRGHRSADAACTDDVDTLIICLAPVPGSGYRA